ncbi:hypothetical protein HPP92_019248 [Vanilla planifolia]|uniref:Trichome birefringence-like N-terminal domain-containing protein n=1 Tax=Vanilla planifolia TaxID=51239 RepID=A0A835QAC4_VANPL|nr:hypothetical protein HPP92_019248 [Vanilla planifolia]
MKPRGLVLSVERPSIPFFAVSKVVLLASLVALFLNVTLSLYTYFSSHYYLIIRQPVLKVSSSISFSVSNSSEDSRIASSSLINNSPFSSSVSLPRNSSLPDYNSVSSFLLPSPRPLLLRPSEHPKLDDQISPNSDFSSKYSNSSYPFESIPSNSSANFNPPSSRIPKAKRAVNNKQRIPKGCDLSKGEWVPDPNAPYYTNLSCMTIQEHQNCMKFGKPNLDFLKWRWKPDGCELPLLDPARFLDFMRGKNLAFIGDSLARNQMQSLMCLLSRVEHPKENPYPSEKVTRMVYAEHNVTIWAFWSPFLIRAEEINRSTNGSNLTAWNLFLDEPDPLWPAHLPTMNHIVVNTGNWYTRPALFHLRGAPVGCHYCHVPDAPFMSLRRANRRAFRTALDAVASGFTAGGVAVVRTVSPAHFEGGKWDKRGDCRRTRPFRPREAPKLEGVEMDMYREQLKEFWRVKWEGSEKGLEMRLLDATRAMLMRPDGHPSRYGHWPQEERVMYNDCVHWCLPGPVDMWNDFLFRMLTI